MRNVQLNQKQVKSKIINLVKIWQLINKHVYVLLVVVIFVYIRFNITSAVQVALEKNLIFFFSFHFFIIII